MRTISRCSVLQGLYHRPADRDVCRAGSPNTLRSSWGQVFNLPLLVLRRAGSPNTLRSLGGSAIASGMMVDLQRRGA